MPFADFWKLTGTFWRVGASKRPQATGRGLRRLLAASTRERGHGVQSLEEIERICYQNLLRQAEDYSELLYGGDEEEEEEDEGTDDEEDEDVG